MDSDASASPVPSSNRPSNSDEPVKIKKEVIDPGYTSASTAFEVTTKILANDIKSEAEIKKELKWEPMNASENKHRDQPKMPLPKVEVKKSDDSRPPSTNTPLQMQRAKKYYQYSKLKRNVAYEPASSSGYYPPASVIWQRVPYLKPRHRKFHAHVHYYKKHRQNTSSQKHNTPNRSQPNIELSTSPLHTVNIEDSSPSDDNVDNENPLSISTETSDKACFFMFVENLPITWNQESCFEELLNEESISVKEFEMMKDSDSKFTGTVQIEFETFEQREEAKKKLHGKDYQGRTLKVELIDSSNISDSDSEYSEPRIKRKKVNIEAAYRPDIDVWETDPKGLYGLKPEFLQSLGIAPPICRWVQVTNFRCNQTQLKEVMKLAGNVLLCTVLTINNKTAKVMYSHPLEAVQAVSMLNKKNFIGGVLNVTMEHCPDRQIILPKGLQEVGPGLGQNGTPLIDIVRHYERFAKGRSSSINFNIFRDINFKMDSADCDIDLKTASPDIGSVQPKNEPESDKEESNGPLLPNPCNPLVNSNIILTCTGGPMSGTSGPMPGPSGPMSGSSDPMPGPSGPMPGASGPISRPRGPMSGISGPNGPMSGVNSPMPVNGGPIRNQMRPNISPMPYPMPMRPGFGPNLNPGPMMAQASRIPRQMGPMPAQMGPVAAQFQVPGLPGHFPVQTHIPGPIANQPGPMVNHPGPMVNHPGPMANQPRPMANQPNPMVNRPNPMANQPNPMVNQPNPMANQPNPMANQPSRFPYQPQPPGVSDSPRKPGPTGPGPRPMVGNNVPAMTMTSASCPGPIPQSSQGNCSVEISNLPPNTTFPFLSERLSSCGPLMSLQMNRDRALAQFATRGHAENCYKQFNQLNVFGNTLQVKFV